MERERRPFSTEEGWAGREGLGIIYDITVLRPAFPAPTLFPAPCYCTVARRCSLCLELGGCNRRRLFHLDSSSPTQRRALRWASSTTPSQALTDTSFLCCSPKSSQPGASRVPRQAEDLEQGGERELWREMLTDLAGTEGQLAHLRASGSQPRLGIGPEGVRNTGLKEPRFEGD